MNWLKFFPQDVCSKVYINGELIIIKKQYLPVCEVRTYDENERYSVDEPKEALYYGIESGNK